MADNTPVPGFPPGIHLNVSRASAMSFIAMQQLKYNKKSPILNEIKSENTHIVPQPLQANEIKLNQSDIHMDSVSRAFTSKALLLEGYEYTPPKIFKKTRKVNLVQCISPGPGEVDPSLLSTLSTNLLNILNTAPDKKEILNEFNRHTLRVNISHEEPIHKYALEKARIIKNTYFTSDT